MTKILEVNLGLESSTGFIACFVKLHAGIPADRLLSGLSSDSLQKSAPCPK